MEYIGFLVLFEGTPNQSSTAALKELVHKAITPVSKSAKIFVINRPNEPNWLDAEDEQERQAILDRLAPHEKFLLGLEGTR